jgi:predicted small lipoprotein YifL
MKPGLITVFLLVLTGLGAGCGQKGPLYRDAPTQSNAETEAVSTNQPVSDDER